MRKNKLFIVFYFKLLLGVARTNPYFSGIPGLQ